MQVPSAKPVILGSLFRNRDRSLSRLAHLTNAELFGTGSCERQVGIDANSGAAPRSWRAYGDFGLMRRGLVVGFEQGEIGPMACGAQHAFVPWRSIYSLLSRNGRAIVAHLRMPTGPHRASIAFASGPEINILYADGSVGIAGDGDLPQWLPGQRELLATRANYSLNPPGDDIWRLVFSGRSPRATQLTSIYPSQVRFISVARNTGTVAYADSNGLWIMGSSGTHKKLLLHQVVNDVAITASGKEVAYIQDDSEAKQFGLWTITSDGSQRRLVFAGNQHTCNMTSPAWSPNDKWIAFTLCVDKGYPNEVSSIFLVHPNGSDLHVLVAGDNPTWSPGGKWIAYEPYSSNPQGPDELDEITPHGHVRRVLLKLIITNGSGGGIDVPDW
jgi:prepilin-type processing-associated H-X9-DG protein